MKNLYLILFSGCLLCAATMTAHAQSGTTGSLSWSISGATLTISGDDAMPDYSRSATPWVSQRSAVTSVVIEPGVTSIGDFAFEKCVDVTSVKIPNTIISIGNFVFEKCVDVRSVTIPASVISIGNSAFAKCVDLSEIVNHATTPQTIDADVFEGVDKSAATLRVSAASVEVYSAAEVWKDFNILPINDEPDYPDVEKEDGKITIFAKFETDPCGDVALIGSFVDWNPDNVSILPKFVSAGVIDGKDWGAEGWWKVTVDVSDESIYYNGEMGLIVAKPVQSTEYGDFVWDYQVAYPDYDPSYIEVKSGDAVVLPGYPDECEIFFKSNTTAAIIFKAWKNDPCISILVPKHDVAFSVTVPEGTPDDAVVRIAGSFALSGYPFWKADGEGMEMTKGDDGRYSITLNLKEGIFEYKYVLNGSWNYEELAVAEEGSDCAPVINNRTQTVTGTNTFNDQIENWKGITTCLPPVTSGSGTTGTLTWEVSDGTLTISGEDEMPDYGGGFNAPWCYLAPYIHAIVISHGVTYIGSAAFADCGYLDLTSVTIPESVTNIGNWAFSHCTGLTSVEIPSSVTHIGIGAFNDCPSLTSIEIPSSVTSIGIWAYNDCSGLTEIINHAATPQDIDTSIHSDVDIVVFANVDKSAVTLRVPAASIEAYRAADVWKDFNIVAIGESGGCENIIASGAAGDNLTWTLCEDGTLTISGTGDMWDYGNTFIDDAYVTTAPWGEHRNIFTALVIENGVTSIGNYAFSNCSGFTGSLILPEGLTNIGNYAFSNCSGFNGDLTLPEGLTGIGDSAFSGCSGFTGSLILPEGLTSIGGYAFSGCSGFTGSLTLPEGLTSIDQWAFLGCSGFIEVFNYRDIPQSIQDDVFSGVPVENIPLRVPAGSVTAYSIADVWKNFKSITAISFNIITVLVEGNGTANASKASAVQGETITLTATANAGYQFKEWTTESPGVTFANAISANTTFTMPANAVTVTAQWEIINYTITYVLNGGTNHAANPATYTIESPTITLQNPTRDGYTFAGWQEGNSIVTGSTGNKTFTAQWTTIPIITINTHPAAITNVTAGSITGSLSVAASVTQGAMLSYQWYSGTDNRNADGTPISGADGSTFFIPATLTAGTYYYFCEVRAAGATSVRSNVAIIIVNPQQITSAEISDVPLVRVYPNPTDGVFSLEFEKEGEYLVTLTDMTGKVLMRQTVKGQRAQMDLSNYPAGAYLLTIDDGKRQSAVRIVKN